MDYDINLKDLSIIENLFYPESFDEYRKIAVFMLGWNKRYILESDILNSFKDEPEIQNEIERGNQGMGAIITVFPNRYIKEGVHPKQGGAEFDGEWGWFDLWSDYYIKPQEELFEYFFAYKLRHTDIFQLDNLLNYQLENNYKNIAAGFIRFLKLLVREHGQKLLNPERVETINEWIALKEKDVALAGTEDSKTKSKIKRERDDRVTLLNQEQTALLIYCLRKTKVILNDEFLNNKDAGIAFSILTGYSADTMRQNLSKEELARTANTKNIEIVEKALKDVIRYIENEIKPEE